MYSGTSRHHRRASIRLAQLFCGVSVAALAAGGAAGAQGQPAAQEDIPETVLITGSLISGAVSVGVPVSSLRTLDFVETGQLSLTDVLKSVPSLDIDAQSSATYGGGTLAFLQNVQIHSLGTGSGVETLLLVDGLRFPPQNYSNDTVNPSIIPQIAIERIDVLSAGASAVYGSDATAGVINVILRRGFDGAMTQLGVTTNPSVGYLQTQAAQLFGKTWDTGNVTVSYTRTDGSAVSTSERDYYTQDFRPWGLQDSRPRGSSIPGTIHTGNAISHDWINDPNPSAFPTGGLRPTTPPSVFSSNAGTDYCAGSRSVPDPNDASKSVTVINQNAPYCYSIPHGQNGVGLTWADIVNNTGGDPALQNIVNNWNNSDARPSLQWNQFHATMDQRISPDLFGFLGPVSFFAEGFYSDQRGKQTYPAGNGQARMELQTNLQVPTFNPYYPVGAPNGLRVDYSFAMEVPTYITGGERAHRVAGGFNLDQLPFDWTGKITYSWTDDQNYGHANNTINTNNVRAALGNTVAASTDGLYAAYTKPDSVPYLNVFCDPNAFQCNDPATLRYITGYRLQDEQFKVEEWAANFSGPIFQLPAGPLEGAIAFQHLKYDWWYRNLQNDNTHGTHVVTNLLDEANQTSYAIFGQLNIPVVSPEMNIPLVENFLIELGYRYDSYDNLSDPVWVRKVAANWTVGYGLTFRGAWGESFRVPSFAENAPTGSRVAGLNDLGGKVNQTDVAVLACNNEGTGVAPGTAIPGSLTALLNPTCSAAEAFQSPGGISVELSGNGAAALLRGHGLGPQNLQQWSLGARFAPTEGFLAGLDVDVSWFRLEFKGLIDNVSLDAGSPDDPLFRDQYTVIPRPDLPITAPENAEFYALAQAIIAVPNRGGFGFDPAYLENIKFIQDIALTNLGSRTFSGLDFTARYDYDLGEWGSVNVGASGYYQFIDKSRVSEFGGIDNRYENKDSGNRLQRVRYRLGWANPKWNVTMFANYFGHGATGSTPDNQGVNVNGNALIPPCFYQTGFGPGSCYPGSPYYGPYDISPNMAPAEVLFDLSVGYQFGEEPAKEWLRNIGIQFSVINLFDKAPPFQVGARGNGAIRAFNEGYSDLQRTFTLQLTKTW
jgi:outer membrane receptor protein involved in Fe transport